MRVGSIVFATDQGLGYLAKDFFDNGVLTDVLVLRHGRRKEHDEWFPGQPRIGSVHDRALGDFVRSMDCMLYLETPFVWDLLKEQTPSALIPMHECMPDPLPATPDLFINPSMLEQRIYGGVHIPVPVPNHIQYRKRDIAQTFVHNAGNGGLLGRNGTKQLLDAWRLVKSPAKLIVRMQEPPKGIDLVIDPRVEIITGTVPQQQLYDRGEVFIFPESFNGLSLPLQEATASGMTVMATNRFPANTWLVEDCLIPCSAYTKTRIAGRLRQFDMAVVDPKDIAATVDAWYGKDVGHLSEQGRLWALQHSWQELKPIYLETLQNLADGRCIA